MPTALTEDDGVDEIGGEEAAEDAVESRESEQEGETAEEEHEEEHGPDAEGPQDDVMASGTVDLVVEDDGAAVQNLHITVRKRASQTIMIASYIYFQHNCYTSP